MFTGNSLMNSLKVKRNGRQARKSLSSNISNFEKFSCNDNEDNHENSNNDTSNEKQEKISHLQSMQSSCQENDQTTIERKARLSISTQKRINMVNDIFWQIQDQEDEKKLQCTCKKLSHQIEHMRIFKPATKIEQKIIFSFSFPDFLKIYDVHKDSNNIVFNGLDHLKFSNFHASESGKVEITFDEKFTLINKMYSCLTYERTGSSNFVAAGTFSSELYLNDFINQKVLRTYQFNRSDSEIPINILFHEKKLFMGDQTGAVKLFDIRSPELESVFHLQQKNQKQISSYQNQVLHIETSGNSLMMVHPYMVNIWDLRERRIVESFNTGNFIKDKNMIKETSFEKAVFSPSNNSEIYFFMKNHNVVNIWGKSQEEDHKNFIKLEENIKDLITFDKLNEVIVLSKNKDSDNQTDITILKKQKGKLLHMDHTTVEGCYDKIFLNHGGDNLYLIGKEQLKVISYYNQEEHISIKKGLKKLIKLKSLRKIF